MLPIAAQAATAATDPVFAVGALVGVFATFAGGIALIVWGIRMFRHAGVRRAGGGAVMDAGARQVPSGRKEFTGIVLIVLGALLLLAFLGSAAAAVGPVATPV